MSRTWSALCALGRLDSSYFSFEVTMCWKVQRENTEKLPILTEYLRTGGGTTLKTSSLVPTQSTPSSCVRRSLGTWWCITILANKSLRMSTSLLSSSGETCCGFRWPPEQDFWAAETIVVDGDDVTTWNCAGQYLVKILFCGVQLGIIIERNVDEIAYIGGRRGTATWRSEAAQHWTRHACP